MDVCAEIIEFPGVLADGDAKPEVKEKKAKPKKGEAKTDDVQTGEEPETTEEKKPEPPKEKMIKMSITGPIRGSIFSEYLERLGPSVEDKDRDRVMLVMSSPGGSVQGSLAAIDVLDAWPQPHVIIAGGVNASAATLFIAHGGLRLALPSARFMLHDSSSINDGSVAEQEERLRVHKEERLIWMQLYQDYIGLSKKELERIIRRDTWFNAIEAMNLGTKGLIDGVVTKLLSGFKYEIIMRNGVRKVVDLHNDDYNEIRNLTVEAVKDQTIVEVK